MSETTFSDAMRMGTYRAARLVGTMDYTPFIILSRSRTGPNLLNSSLGSHPNVHVKGEHFGHLRGDTIENATHRCSASNRARYAPQDAKCFTIIRITVIPPHFSRCSRRTHV